MSKKNGLYRPRTQLEEVTTPRKYPEPRLDVLHHERIFDEESPSKPLADIRLPPEYRWAHTLAGQGNV